MPTGGDWTWTPPADSDSGSAVFAGVPIVASGLVSPTPSLRWWPPPPSRVPQYRTLASTIAADGNNIWTNVLNSWGDNFFKSLVELVEKDP